MTQTSNGIGQIPLEELASLPSFYVPTLSHDKSKIAFYWDKSGQLELYIMDTTPDAEPQKISDGEVPKSVRSGFCWTRDDKAIIYAKDNHGDEQHNLWRFDIESGTAEQLTDNPKAQEYPMQVSPDNTTLLVNSNLNGQMNLYLFDLEAKTYHQLTDYQFPAGGARWSPDGDKIVYGANETSDFKNNDIYMMNADGSDQKMLFQSKVGAQDGVSDWSKDGRYLAIGSDNSGKSRVGVLDLETNEARWLSPEGRTQYPGRFSPDGTKLLSAEGEDSMIATQVYDVHNGDAIPVELPPGMSFNADWLDNEHFIVNIATPTSRPELRDYALQDGTSNVLLKADYGSIDPDLFVDNEYIWYESTDGLKIPAIVYRPRNLDPNKKYPALVEIHGGPTAQFFRGFNTYAQFLTDNGYIVIQPNVRGSTGYGVEFRDMNLKDWGGGDLEDIEGAVNYLKTLPEVDPERIGVWGGSYGGYLTFMAMTKKPDLWKAGVAWVGISDIKRLYDSSMDHFKYYLNQQMGDPEADADLWYDRSAVNFLQHMTGKLYIIHGENDPRCPIEQARIVRDRLLELGKVEGEDFEYTELTDEGHGSGDIQQKIRSYNLLVDFLNENL